MEKCNILNNYFKSVFTKENTTTIRYQILTNTQHGFRNETFLWLSTLDNSTRSQQRPWPKEECRRCHPRLIKKVFDTVPHLHLLSKVEVLWYQPPSPFLDIHILDWTISGSSIGRKDINSSLSRSWSPTRNSSWTTTVSSVHKRFTRENHISNLIIYRWHHSVHFVLTSFN